MKMRGADNHCAHGVRAAVAGAAPAHSNASGESTRTARMRSMSHRRGGRPGRHRPRARRLRDPELAGGLRPVPGLPARQAVVLLRDPQRHATDDSDGRHRVDPRARHRRVRGEDARRRRPVHQGRSGRACRGCRPTRMWRDGRHRCGHQHRPGQPRRQCRGDRLRRGGQRRRDGIPAGRCAHDHRCRRGRSKAGARVRVRRDPHRQLVSY
jgi:hypothetical protein